MNRARELAELLDGLPKGDPNAQIHIVWATHFNTPQFSPDFLRAVGALQEKFDLLHADLEASKLSDRSKKLYQKSVAQLKPFVKIPDLNNLLVSHLSKKADQVDILFLASDALPEFLVPDINPLTLEALTEEIELLIDEVAKMDAPASFVKMLISALDTLLLALRSYNSLGPDGAAKIYGVAAAELARIYHGRNVTEPAQKSKVQRALGVCKKAGAAVIFAGAVVGGAHTAITDGSDLLGIGNEVEEGGDAEAGAGEKKQGGEET